MQHRKIDNSIEESILTGLIISDKFLRDTTHLIKKDFFSNQYAKIISRWCIEYYKKYKESPKKLIQDIYNVKKEKLKDEDAELIKNFLIKLSHDFENEESINEDYLIDKAIRYFKMRSLQTSAEKIISLIDLRQIDEAEEEITKYKKIIEQTTQWIDPFDDSIITKFFQDELDKSHILFRFPGALGNLIGDFERNWLFAVLAPAKKGKSFWLQEIAIHGVLVKKKVVFISLEMDSRRVLKRLYKRLTSFGNESKEYIYPVFDCKKNQDGSCKKVQRTNKLSLIDSDGNKPKYFDQNSRYLICDVCRGSRDFMPETWFTKYKRPKMNLKNSAKSLKGIANTYGRNLKVLSFPAFSANISSIKSTLDKLEYSENFVPDIIVIDYADILAPESSTEGRERLDETWKTLKNLADSRHCLVVTASQTNRASFKKKNVTQIDVAEDIRKIAHIDCGISINQLPAEKIAGVTRIAKVAGRDTGFDEYTTCMVLQNLELGQTNLDSEITYSAFSESDSPENM